MQKLSVDKTLLRLYMDGQCSKEQLVIIREYLHNPAYQESLEEWLITDWQDVAGQVYAAEEKDDNKFQQFLSIVQTPVADATKQAPVKRMPVRRWWQVAAAAVVICVAGYMGLQWKQQEQSKQLALLEHEMVQLHNEAGKRTMIILPDSSRVYLNAVSSLQYNKNFGKTNRDLTLDGEAFFVVKHGKEFPFSVHSGSITTIDIGTAFNIRYRTADPVVKVAVAEGSVNVMDHRKTEQKLITLLTQKQQLSFDVGNSQALVQELQDAAAIGGWREGNLHFHKQPLQEVAKELERFYDIHIRFAQPAIAGMLITTSIRNASAKEALDIIALTAGVEIQQSDKDVLIK